MIPDPASPALVTLAETSSTIIGLRQRVHRENKVRMIWMNFHNIFAAGVTLLDCYSRSPEVRERMPLRSIEASVHACSAVMWAMVERFPAAKIKRDAFDSFAKASLDSLSTTGSRNTALGTPKFPSNGNILLPDWPVWDASTTLTSDEVPIANLRTSSTQGFNHTSGNQVVVSGSEILFEEAGEITSWNDPQYEWMNSDFDPTLYENQI
jgi:hypothetical protein